MISKSDVFVIFSQFQVLIESQFSTKIKNVQIDWDGEYQKLFFFVNLGIHHHISCPHTNEQNGLVKRRN